MQTQLPCETPLVTPLGVFNSPQSTKATADLVLRPGQKSEVIKYVFSSQRQPQVKSSKKTNKRPYQRSLYAINIFYCSLLFVERKKLLRSKWFSFLTPALDLCKPSTTNYLVISVHCLLFASKSQEALHCT